MTRPRIAAGGSTAGDWGPNLLHRGALLISWIMLGAVFALVALAAGRAAAAAEVAAVEESQMITLDNGILQVCCQLDSGEWTARRGGRALLAEGHLHPSAAPPSSARLGPFRCGLGAGKAVEMAWSDGAVRRLILFESVPWVCVQSAFRNPGHEPVTLRAETALRATIDLGHDAEAFRGFDPEGPYSFQPGEKKTSFCFAAAAEPASRRGMVAGWVTHHKASGVISLRRGDAGRLEVEAESQFGRLEVPPQGLVEGEMVALGWFDDALVGLESYADACALAHDVRLPPRPPSGYCTWYHAGASDEQKMAELARFAGQELRPWGLEFLQIDDGWQIGSRDFTAHNPAGKYPSGMTTTAQTVADAGFTPGIWFIPFAWDRACPSLAEHHDWFVHRADGSIYSVYWAGDCLDMTHPRARSFLRDVVARLTREWGYRYIKIDGLWAGMATKILYPSPAYRPDELGEAVLHDPRQTQIEAYRSGLELVREAAGADVFILGCNIAQNARTLGASIGLVDGMRIGHDIGANWKAVRGCAAPASHFYFFHGKTWYNDPDCLMLREPLTLDQARAWASLIALSGQMNVVSEWLPGLPEERLDILRRTIPNHGGLGRPLDLFEHDLPQVWHYRARRGGETVDLVGLFNWSDQPANLRFDPHSAGWDSERLPQNVAQPPSAVQNLPHDRGRPCYEMGNGIASDPTEPAAVVGFDFWENRFVPPASGAMEWTLRPESCRVLALARLAHPDRPQLVSTSRHVTQGVLDVCELGWDPETGTLAGRSELMADEAYELRIYAPQGPSRRWAAREPALSPADRTAGVRAACRQEGPEIRIELRSPAARTVEWQIPFELSDVR